MAILTKLPPPSSSLRTLQSAASENLHRLGSSVGVPSAMSNKMGAEAVAIGPISNAPEVTVQPIPRGVTSSEKTRDLLLNSIPRKSFDNWPTQSQGILELVESMEEKAQDHSVRDGNTVPLAKEAFPVLDSSLGDSVRMSRINDSARMEWLRQQQQDGLERAKQELYKSSQDMEHAVKEAALHKHWEEISW